MERLSIAALVCALVFQLSCGGGGGGGGARVALLDRNGDGSITVLAFGDSITQGRGDGPSAGSLPPREVAGYPARLEFSLGVPVINSGVGGEITREGANRIGGALQATNPDFVILLEGANDISNARKNEIVPNLQRMIDQVIAFGAVPLLGTLTPTCCNREVSTPPQLVRNANVLIRQLARDNAIDLVDFEIALAPMDGVYVEGAGLLHEPDGLHPTPDGYDVMADTAARVFGFSFEPAPSEDSADATA